MSLVTNRFQMPQSSKFKPATWRPWQVTYGNTLYNPCWRPAFAVKIKFSHKTYWTLKSIKELHSMNKEFWFWTRPWLVHSIILNLSSKLYTNWITPALLYFWEKSLCERHRVSVRCPPRPRVSSKCAFRISFSTCQRSVKLEKVYVPYPGTRYGDRWPC